MLMNPSPFAFLVVSLPPRMSFYINKFSLPELRSLQATYACVGATRTECKPKEKGVTNGLPCSAALPSFQPSLHPHCANTPDTAFDKGEKAFRIARI